MLATTFKVLKMSLEKYILKVSRKKEILFLRSFLVKKARIFIQWTYLEPIIGPATELHITVLVIEGEPGDVDLAGGHEDARGDVCTTTTAGHHHVCWISSIKSFTCTENEIINFI